LNWRKITLDIRNQNQKTILQEDNKNQELLEVEVVIIIIPIEGIMIMDLLRVMIIEILKDSISLEEIMITIKIINIKSMIDMKYKKDKMREDL
jgi:hypothetical protein